ncbi:MAG: UDP-N-acetylmuramoylalanyl-D-glutamyl-2,6-diaminopimelate--D-alanyl-D-alanine ligase [Acidimicrobiales bacterium]|nr:UDP-N-acetylmuramoylalanyl-D-glutamyl-2,6-diaminopimelate--D-alanyl-D-alanine ligase [Acidimicrobiales bacterium]
MKVALSDVAAVVGGTLHGPDGTVDGATIDSRAVRPGALFVPVVASRDGHDYIEQALAAGAAAYLSSRGSGPGTAVLVEDTAAALAALGRWARDQLSGPVVAVTGSAGKTSTKDLLGALLQPELPTVVSERSFNNELGVPLTLFNADDGTHAAVLEMGARGFGHIAWLCELARPDVGVVTNVAAAHTEMFGSVDGVAQAKGELVSALPASGTAVLNADDERVAAMAARTAARVLGFGVESGDVRAVDPVLDDELRVSFRLDTPWGEAEVHLQARGLHQAVNAAAAAAAALAVAVPLDHIASRLETATLSPWRMDVRRAPSGILVINDAYNANPASMTEALKALAHVPARRRIAVLGPMLELGDLSDDEHARVGALTRELGVRAIAVGAPAYGVDDVASIDDALAVLDPLGDGDAVLVKASRAAGLERLAALLLEEDTAW